MISRTSARPYSSSIEDYTKAIYALERQHDAPVATNDLAARLAVTPASASGMIRKLADAGLAKHVPYRGVQLSPAGEQLALTVLRRHRLVESYLVDVGGMDWEQVHDEAEVLEHHLSDAVLELIADKLGDPQFDVHGDPIPTRDGRIDLTPVRPLSKLAVGTRGALSRVLDHDAEPLRDLRELDVPLGSEMTVVDVGAGGEIDVDIDGRTVTVTAPVARIMLIAELAVVQT